MKLKDYIDHAGYKTIADAARAAGYGHETFRKWVNGERRPRNAEDVQRIEEWSKGSVTPRDWYSTSAAA